MANGQTFIADMQRWVGQDKNRLEKLGRQTVQELAIRTQDNTGPPVGPNIITAFLISSWQPSINAAPPEPANGGRMPPGFTGTMNKDTEMELSMMIATMKPGDVFFYVNNAIYAPRQNWGFSGVDSLGRNVHQQGRFFLEKTLAQWPQIVAEVAADLNFSP